MSETCAYRLAVWLTDTPDCTLRYIVHAFERQRLEWLIKLLIHRLTKWRSVWFTDRLMSRVSFCNVVECQRGDSACKFVSRDWAQLESNAHILETPHGKLTDRASGCLND